MFSSHHQQKQRRFSTEAKQNLSFYTYAHAQYGTGIENRETEMLDLFL